MSSLHLALALGGDGSGWSVPWSLHAREAEVGLIDLVTLDVPAGDADGETDGELDAVRAATRLAAATRSVGLLPTVHAGRSEPGAIGRAVQALAAASGGRAGLHLRVPVPADEQGWVQAVRRAWTVGASGPGQPGGRTGPVVALPGRTGRGPRALPAEAADLAFVAPRTTVDVQQTVAAARTAGGPRHLLGDLVVVVDDDAARARRRWELSAGRAPSTAPAGARVFCGTPAQLADLALGWRTAGLCGLRLHPVDPARDLRAVTRGLVPELQRRGAFRRAYRGRDLRGRLEEPLTAAVGRAARSSEHCSAA